MESIGKTLPLDEWEEKYQPRKNPRDPDGSYDGCMFETYGEDIEAVHAAASENRVWTLFDDGKTIGAGYHFVNRLAYFITEVPWEDGDIEVHDDAWDDMDDDEDEENFDDEED